MTQSNDQRLAGRTPLEAGRLDPTRLPASTPSTSAAALHLGDDLDETAT
jgi:hypothetical protein